MHKHMQKVLTMKGNNMLITMGFDDSVFGQIMLEFRKENQFHMNSNPDFGNSQFITMPQDAK